MENWMFLCYKGNYISFPDVCKIFIDIKEDLISTWENKILRGLDLRVHYDKLADDLTTKDMGYCSKNPQDITLVPSVRD